MVGCQVVAIPPPLRWYILRSASVRRSDAHVQVAGQSARAARVLRRDECKRSEATGMTSRTAFDPLNATVAEQRGRCLRAVELARIASGPRWQQQQLIDLVRRHSAARALRGIEDVTHHRQ